MKRIRIGMLMLLVVIAVLGVALVAQSRRATRLERELVARSRQAATLEQELMEQTRRATELESQWGEQVQRAETLEVELEEQNRRVANLQGEIKERKAKDEKQRANYTALIRDLRDRLEKQPRSPIDADGAAKEGK